MGSMDEQFAGCDNFFFLFLVFGVGGEREIERERMREGVGTTYC